MRTAPDRSLPKFLGTLGIIAAVFVVCMASVAGCAEVRPDNTPRSPVGHGR